MMKPLLLIPAFLMAFAFLSCEKDNELSSTELSGEWRLVEVLYDPGDGSGTFQPVDSDKTITFNADGTYSATGSICELSEEANQNSSGTYDTVSKLIEPSDCRAVPAEAQTISYTLEGNELVLQYRCIEPCLHTSISGNSFAAKRVSE